MSTEKKEISGAAIALLGASALFLEGRVFMDLWRWFVVPIGAPAVGYFQAMGIGVLVTLATRTNGVARDDFKQITENCSLVLWAWAIGWLLSHGMPR